MDVLTNLMGGILSQCICTPNHHIVHFRYLTILSIKPQLGLPWWCNGYESACQCRGHGFDPWSGKIPRAAEQLSPCATTTEARVPRARAPQQEKPPQ